MADLRSASRSLAMPRSASTSRCLEGGLHRSACRASSADRVRHSSSAAALLSARGLGCVSGSAGSRTASPGLGNGHFSGPSNEPSSQESASSSTPNSGSSKLRVVCRLRPMTDLEKRSGTVPAVTAFTDRGEVTAVRARDGRQLRHNFHFDHVLSSFSTQQDVFAVALKPLIEDVLAGREAAALAYGQTGTGKTYTMEGDLDSEHGRGLVPRAAAAVIHALHVGDYSGHSVMVSCLEIYNEELSDLLAQSQNQKLDLKESGRGVCCHGLSEVLVTSVGEIQELIRRAQERRRVAETRINARSSRSHSIFTLKVTSVRQVSGGEAETTGKLHLVDLAGSECAKKAALSDHSRDASMAMRNGVGGGVVCQQTLEGERERRNINQSLLTLGRVIVALRGEGARVPYRDSKLTRLLQEALGGRCRTVIIATVSPSQLAVDESTSTLTYAEQASGIQNRSVAPASLFRSLSGRAIDDGGSNEEWNNLLMRCEYLSQEVEEAQGALEKKVRETVDLDRQVETAETRRNLAIKQFEEAQLVVAERNFIFKRTAEFADQKTVETRRLAEVLDIAVVRAVGLTRRLEQREAEALAVRRRARDLCLSGEERSAALATAARGAASAAKVLVGDANAVQNSSVNSVSQVATGQHQMLNDLAEGTCAHGSQLRKQLSTAVSHASEETRADYAETESRLSAIDAGVRRASRASVDARRRLLNLIKPVPFVGDYTDAVGDELSARPVPVSETLEHLAETAASRGQALQAKLASAASFLHSAVTEISTAKERGEAELKAAIDAAAQALATARTETSQELTNIQATLREAAADQRAANTSTVFERRASDTETALADSIKDSVSVLKATRLEISLEVEELRHQRSMEKEIVAELRRQQEELAADLEKAQLSLASVTKTAESACLSLSAVRDEQARLRAEAIKAVVSGVDTLVRQQLDGLEEKLTAGSDPILGHLNAIAAGAQAAGVAASEAERRAVLPRESISKCAGIWSAEVGGACDRIMAAQNRAATAALDASAASATAAEQLSGIGQGLLVWGSACERVAGSLDDSRAIVGSLQAAQEDVHKRWLLDRERSLSATSAWGSSSAAIVGSLESVSGLNSDAATLQVEQISGITGSVDRLASALSGCADTAAEQLSQSIGEAANALQLHRSASQAANQKAVLHWSDFERVHMDSLKSLDARSTEAIALADSAMMLGSERLSSDKLQVEVLHDRCSEVLTTLAESHSNGISEQCEHWRSGMAAEPLSAFAEDMVFEDSNFDVYPDLSTSIPNVDSVLSRPSEQQLIAEFRTGLASSGTVHNSVPGVSVLQPPEERFVSRRGGLPAPPQEDCRRSPILQQGLKFSGGAKHVDDAANNTARIALRELQPTAL